MDLQTLSDREDIVDLISRSNKASFTATFYGADVENNSRAAGWEGPRR